MTDEQININRTPEPYTKRRTNILRWTALLYVFISVIVGLSTELNPFLLSICFLTILFILDYNRRLKWVQYSLVSLDTNDQGIRLSFYDKDKLKTETISWDNFNISSGSTYTRNPTRCLSIKNGDNIIASFYADDTFDNKKLDGLYKDLHKLKTANA